MKKRLLAKHHIAEALRAAIAEAKGAEDLARRLRAKTKLRLVRMSDEKLWELAKLTSSSPQGRAVELTCQGYKEAREQAIYS